MLKWLGKPFLPPAETSNWRLAQQATYPVVCRFSIVYQQCLT